MVLFKINLQSGDQAINPLNYSVLGILDYFVLTQMSKICSLVELKFP